MPGLFLNCYYLLSYDLSFLTITISSVFDFNMVVQCFWFRDGCLMEMLSWFSTSATSAWFGSARMVRDGLIKQYVLVLDLCGLSSDPFSLTRLVMIASTPLALLLVICHVLISTSSSGLRDRGKSLVIMLLVCWFVAWFAAQGDGG